MARSSESHTVSTSTEQERDRTDAAILAAVRAIRYGSVEVIIHDSAVVQIERKEKLRFTAPSSKSSC